MLQSVHEGCLGYQAAVIAALDLLSRNQQGVPKQSTLQLIAILKSVTWEFAPQCTSSTSIAEGIHALFLRLALKYCGKGSTYIIIDSFNLDIYFSEDSRKSERGLQPVLSLPRTLTNNDWTAEEVAAFKVALADMFGWKKPI